MAYLNTNSRTVSTPNNETFQPLGRTAMLTGVFMGWVKRTDDVQKMGRLQVWIPEFGSAPEDAAGWITVSYCSPFAGATNVDTANKGDVKQFEGTQTSYGMWMVPPDINNQVIVMFIGGDAARGIWIGSMFNQFMNNMVPAMAADTNNYQYPGKNIPVAEYNKWDTKVTQPDKATKPYEATKFKGLGNQGLITDPNRGVTDASARRDSPSTVFGILTPGPIIDKTVSPENIRRKGGSSFIMDDADGSEVIQMVTKSGAQININETTGFVYLINRDGTAWVQMDAKGNIDIFGATNISMRAQRDINLRADRNINIEAGQNIYMKAAKDTTETTTSFTYDVNNVPKPSTIPYWKYVGEGQGQGGNIVTQALNNTHTTVKNNSYLSVGTNQNIIIGGNITETAATYSLTAGNIKNVGAVQVRGTLDVTDDAAFGKSLGVVDTVHANKGQFPAELIGKIPGVQSGDGVDTGGSPGSAVSVPVPPDPTKAEVKPMLDKMNILATWADPESKFKRNAESVSTTVTRLPTYESAPEHESFTYKSVAGYVPRANEGDKTYEGSGGAGNGATAPPATNTTPGANNKEIPQESPVDSVVTKDFNMAAYQCQLKIHEGVRYKSYLDSLGLPTAGIGHLLRTNEIAMYPVPTSVSEEQVNNWFNQDAPTSIKGAQELLGIDTWGELSDVRKRACADLCYNMGKGRLSKFVRFIAGMKAGNWNLAGQSLRDSIWFTQVGRRGPNIITMVVQNIDPNGCDRKYPI
jgi:lysozyme